MQGVGRAGALQAAEAEPLLPGVVLAPFYPPPLTTSESPEHS